MEEVKNLMTGIIPAGLTPISCVCVIKLIGINEEFVSDHLVQPRAHQLERGGRACTAGHIRISRHAELIAILAPNHYYMVNATQSSSLMLMLMLVLMQHTQMSFGNFYI